jgi:hypothetical protein
MQVERFPEVVAQTVRVLRSGVEASALSSDPCVALLELSGRPRS